jgi:hypothetical protein
MSNQITDLITSVKALELVVDIQIKQIIELQSQHNVVVDNITDLQGCVNQLETAANGVLWPEGQPPVRATQATCPHVVTGNDGTTFCNLAEVSAAQPRQEEPTPPPAPAGGLLEQLQAPVRSSGGFPAEDEWRTVIHAVAEWLDARGNRGSAAELRREANR